MAHESPDRTKRRESGAVPSDAPWINIRLCCRYVHQGKGNSAWACPATAQSTRSRCTLLKNKSQRRPWRVTQSGSASTPAFSTWASTYLEGHKARPDVRARSKRAATCRTCIPRHHRSMAMGRTTPPGFWLRISADSSSSCTCGNPPRTRVSMMNVRSPCMAAGEWLSSRECIRLPHSRNKLIVHAARFLSLSRYDRIHMLCSRTQRRVEHRDGQIMAGPRAHAC
jgi:hypothetical protein